MSIDINENTVIALKIAPGESASGAAESAQPQGAGPALTIRIKLARSSGLLAVNSLRCCSSHFTKAAGPHVTSSTGLARPL
jgi:hypothetical protein